ncbi:co-chaperone YbbN [Microvirga sp. W0021]|uniref:Co-chaperone YbbN n=1 Tax=Hohaiivirga grylli TaxID=3133970 RepID=A0ABV0BF48_9HYPH
MLTDNTAAPNTALISDTTTQGFQQDVLMASTQQPVLVYFWSTRSEVCRQQAPVLEKFVTSAGGKVKMVRLDIDAHPAIAGQLGIQSIPAVVAFQNGQFVDGFMGVIPEPQMKEFIERLTGPLGPSPVEALMEKASELMEANDMAGAAQIYAAILGQDQANIPAIVGLVKIHIAMGDLEHARRFLEMVPANKVNDPAVTAVQAALEIAEQAEDLGDTEELRRRVEADPKDYQARFDLALALNARNKREEAADLLLDIVRRDRKWNDDGARKQLVQFFEAWGPMDEATLDGRRRLSSILFA